MSKKNKIIYFIVLTLFLIVFNRFFSKLILETLRFKAKENSLLDLVFVQNTGAAFSILENSQLFLILFSIIALILILFNTLKNISKFSTLIIFWISMLTVGIGCNLFERLTLGYVTDFFKLNFIEFPIFNISDAFISISVLALIIIITKREFLK